MNFVHKSYSIAGKFIKYDSLARIEGILFMGKRSFYPHWSVLLSDITDYS